MLRFLMENPIREGRGKDIRGVGGREIKLGRQGYTERGRQKGG